MNIDRAEAVEIKCRLAVVERELDEFSFIVSHDLATAFRHVAQFSILLVQDLGQGISDNQRLYADGVWAAIAKCQSMMEQLLAFSRIQQKSLDLRPIDATHAAETAVLQLRDC